MSTGSPDTRQRATESTISDFGDQWTRFQDNSGYYGSRGLFEDIVGPVLDPREIAGRRVADIGSGTGRIVEMLLAEGAAQVAAIEPSRAYDVLVRRFADRPDRVTVHRARGEEIAQCGPVDLVFSIGVLHHIPDPGPVVRAAWQALVPGGRIVIWLYGREGNRIYLALALPLRFVTRRLPDRLLDAVVRVLDLPLCLYMALCRVLPLPLHGYMRNVLARMAADKRRLIIFDQLNPAYAKYYTRREAVALLERAEFVGVDTFHRHGYSWTVIGTKPEGAPS